MHLSQSVSDAACEIAYNIDVVAMTLQNTTKGARNTTWNAHMMKVLHIYALARNANRSMGVKKNCPCAIISLGRIAGQE